MGGEQFAMPESVSVPVTVTVTFVLFQPAAFAWGAAAACAVGAVLSIFTGDEAYVAVLPATSVAVTLPVTADPSAVSKIGLGTEVEANPDKASVTVNGTFTFVLFHPAALAAGVAGPNVTTGGVLSIFTEADVKVAVLPARSVTVTVPMTDAPSAVSTRGLGTDVDPTPDKASAAVNGNTTFVLFHPAGFGGGFAAPNTSVGGVLSILMPATVTAGLMFPATSVHVPDAA